MSFTLVRIIPHLKVHGLSSGTRTATIVCMNENWIYDPGFDDYTALRDEFYATQEEEQEEQRLIWAQLESEMIDRSPPHQLELFPEMQ